MEDLLHMIKVVRYWQNKCLSTALLMLSSTVKLNSDGMERLVSSCHIHIKTDG